MRKQDLLSVAETMGQRLVSQAMWDGHTCTWEVRIPAPSHFDVERTAPAAAGGDVYQGSAGIAWFLAQLYRVTGDRNVARTALGGIRHALLHAARQPTHRFGFHTGRVGVAFVAVQLADVLNKPRLCDAALAILEPMKGHEQHDDRLDVLTGAAGAIPALLQLSHELQQPALEKMACGLGELLFEKVQRGPAGWSWNTMSLSTAQHLTGLGHGASGIGLALLELYRATGQGAYRFAAEMAFLYERQLYDAKVGNWPDFRHPELSDLIFYHPAEAPCDDHDGCGQAFATTWCHGAPGIGLTRVRAYELTRQELYRQEAEAALISSLSSLSASLANGALDFTLCHGFGGICELPLLAAEVFRDPRLTKRCHECAERGWDRHSRGDSIWPSGVIDGAQDPSLMLGDAGIGAFYLRLYSEETPSLLLLRPWVEPREQMPEDEGFADLAALSTQESFGKTLRSLDALGHWPLTVSLTPNEDGPLMRSPAQTTYDKLRRFVASQQGPRKTMMEDAFRRERVAYELTLTPSDFTAESLNELARLEPDEICWEEVLLSWSEGAELVTNRWDWNSWLIWGAGGAPSDEEVYAMLLRRHSQVCTRQITPFAAAVLSAMTHPITLQGLTSRVASVLNDSETVEPATLYHQIEQQVRELYRAGFVDVTEYVGARRATAG